jgi:hypothetical protein
MAPDPNAAYVQATDLELAKTAVIQQEKVGRGWVLHATCPRCGHPVSTFVPRSGYGVGLLRLKRKQEPIDTVVTFECNCTTPHANSPAASVGCGFYRGFPIRTP